MLLPGAPRPPSSAKRAISGSHKTASRVSRGIVSLRSCSRLACSSAVTDESPVTCPPGCARFVTKPDATGSDVTMTMGMVDVAPFTAKAAGLFPTMITSALRSTSSSVSLGRRSMCPCAVRNSILMLRPSTYPNSRSHWPSALTVASRGPAPPASTPTIDTPSCSAPTQAIAATRFNADATRASPRVTAPPRRREAKST